MSATVVAGVTSGCMTAYKRSVGANTQSSFQRVYRTDFNVAWQATLDALKSMRLDVTNREAGFVQTRWMDNTKEKNFSDGDGVSAPYMKAQFRFKISVSSGVYRGKDAIKVAVQREQFAQRDALDDNRALESDSIEENTLLYRIGRLINLRTRLAKLEEYRTRMEIRRATMEDPNAGFEGGPALEDLPPDPDSDFPADPEEALPPMPPEELSDDGEGFIPEPPTSG